MQAPPAVSLREVAKTFEGVVAVDAATFDLVRGQFLTILGPSGCGKTTLLRMIAGFIEPSAGEIRINGVPVVDVPPHRRSIGMVFQRLALFPHMTAAQNIAYPLRMRRFPAAEVPALVDRYLKLVRLAGFGDRRIHELSGGQQQRVAIARALSFSPDLLLLDEPLSALDKKLREEMQLEFRRIQRELGVTTINVTHDQREALVMSDRIVVMDAGRIQQTDAPMGMYRNPANRFVAGFIGLTTFLPGTVIREFEDCAWVIVGERELLGRRGDRALGEGALVDCALRAEQIRIMAVDDTHTELDQVVAATVRQSIFEGDRLVYELHCPELGDAVVYGFDHDPTHHTVHPAGTAVRIGWNRNDLMVFDKPS